MASLVDYQITAEQGDISRDGSTSVTEVHTIVTDLPVDKAWILGRLRAKLNRESDRDPGYYWERISPKRIKRLQWDVECVATPFQQEALAEDPLQRPAIITADGSLVTEPTNFDWEGNPIVTTAGEFIGGVERERGILVYHVTKNIGKDPAWMDDYNGAVNLDAVTIRNRTRPKGTLKLLNPQLSAYGVENRVRFCTVTFDLLYDSRGHKPERWNLGTLQLVQREQNGRKIWKQERILTGTPALPVESPVPLTIRGQVLENYLAASADGKPVDVSKLVKLSWNVQPLLPFNGVFPLK